MDHIKQQFFMIGEELKILADKISKLEKKNDSPKKKYGTIQEKL